MKKPSLPPKSRGPLRPVRLAASAGFVLGTLIMLVMEHGLTDVESLVSIQMYVFYCLPPAIILGCVAAILQRVGKSKSS
ncbi:MAG: hypothetical protein ACYDD1_01580 [Caulobacteraceae bacterium]